MVEGIEVAMFLKTGTHLEGRWVELDHYQNLKRWTLAHLNFNLSFFYRVPVPIFPLYFLLLGLCLNFVELNFGFSVFSFMNPVQVSDFCTSFWILFKFYEPNTTYFECSWRIKLSIWPHTCGLWVVICFVDRVSQRVFNTSSKHDVWFYSWSRR